MTVDEVVQDENHDMGADIGAAPMAAVLLDEDSSGALVCHESSIGLVCAIVLLLFVDVFVADGSFGEAIDADEEEERKGKKFMLTG